jgi:hypothetical protein
MNNLNCKPKESFAIFDSGTVFSVIDIEGNGVLSSGFNRVALHAIHCLAFTSMFLIKHSLQSQNDSGSCMLLLSISELTNILAVLSVHVVSETNFEFDCSIELDFAFLGHNISITLPDFSSHAIALSLLFFTFALGFALRLGAVEEVHQMKFGMDVSTKSIEDSESLVFVIKDELESVILLALSTESIGLLNVKLLTDCKFFSASVILIGLAKVKISSLFVIIVLLYVIGGGRVKSKLGNVVISRGIFGKFTGTTVSSCSIFILDLPFNFPRYFSFSLSSDLERESTIKY